ncbi:MAG: LysE family translocator [Gammaproteobacteria bacterium]
MFPLDIWLAYTTACVLLVLAPGPDNLLAIGRGLSQGRIAAVVSGAASGAGIVFHVLAATFGLTLLIQTSALAFVAVKVVGAGYLLWLGFKVLRSRGLIAIDPVAPVPHRSIFLTGFLSAALNPKPGLFVLAFLPQFVSPARGSVMAQMLGYGLWFALITAVGFSLMGIFAARLSAWLQRRPRVVGAMNMGAGVSFIAAGLSVAALKQR